MKAMKTTTLILALFSFLTISANHRNHKKNKPFIKVALLLDTSNSMDGLINQAKAQLWDIVNELAYAKCEHETPNLKIALYEYGNDGLPSSEGYIRQVIGFTDDLDDISEHLFSLTTNGGSEYCGQVIQTSLKQLDWGGNEKDLKLIFIAGNEPFTQGKIDYRNAATNAKEKDVVVNTIFCGNYDLGINGMWRNGAALTNGDYMAIDHNREIVQIATPYDDRILKLNIQLNHTYVPYGSAGKRKKSLQMAQDAEAEDLDEVVIVKRAVSKSSGFYKNESWDLVDAAKDKNFKFNSLKKEQLPSELKSKSSEEIKQYVTQKSKERSKVQKEIQELNKKRNQYIADQQKNTDNKSLESVMIKAIKKQAAKKNYKWE